MSLQNVRFKNGFIPYCLSLFLLLGSHQLSAQLLPYTSAEEEETEEEQLPEDVLGRSTPRGTVNGFISAVADQDYSLAARYLELPSGPEQPTGEELALVLQKLLNQGSLVASARISNEPEGNTEDGLAPDQDRVGMISVEGERVEVLVERIEAEDDKLIWKFASSSISEISAVEDDWVSLVERVLPPFLQGNFWWGVPIGHWLIGILLIAVAYLLAWAPTVLVSLFIPRVYKPAGVDPLAGVLKALMLPIRLYLAVWLFVALSREAGISIVLRQLFSGLTIIVGVVAILLLLWRLTEFLGTFSKNKMLNRGNASGMSVVLFLKRAAKITIIIVGFIAILDVFGIDVTAGIAALGIGGIALALGAQKTMENFVGSVTLISDQPVRVGDFCKVGDIVGTVESIGMRSTRIRTLARTIVTIPNGEFSSAKIENYAHRDRFWFHPVFNMRYETTPDQIRYLLVELRKVMYAHPKVSPEPARIRFTQLASASINLEVFAYIMASSFDEFLEVQEDLLLRMMDVVEKSGTGFAFPSQTIYLARDSGLSEEKSKGAEEQVKRWRKEQDLQIPHFDPEKIEQLKDSLSYPPEGSVSSRK